MDFADDTYTMYADYVEFDINDKRNIAIKILLVNEKTDSLWKLELGCTR